MPGSLQIDTFNPNVQLDEGDERIYVPGNIAVIDGRRELFDTDIDAPVLTVKFSSFLHQPLQWAFDRKTRKAAQAIAADATDSELVSMAQTLGAMGNPIAAPSLIALCNHPRHFVRRAAMQALGRVDPAQLLPHLHNSAENAPHPHMQAAAKRALSRISKQGQPHANYH